VIRVELYSKPDCSLCEVLKAALLEAQAQVPFELVEVDIRTDPALWERYRHDVPVVHIGGRKAFKHRASVAQLVDRLSREGGT
jgi:hypothetical protein